MWFRGVDISSPAVKKSGLSAAAYYALIVLDDFPDGAPGMYPMLLAAYNNWIRVARHRNQGIFSLQHTYAGGRNTPEFAEQQVHRLLSTVAAEPLHNVYEGPPHDADQPGAGAGAALQ